MSAYLYCKNCYEQEYLEHYYYVCPSCGYDNSYHYHDHDHDDDDDDD